MTGGQLDLEPYASETASELVLTKPVESEFFKMESNSGLTPEPRKRQRGGARPGAGRKPGGSLTARVSINQAEELRRVQLQHSELLVAILEQLRAGATCPLIANALSSRSEISK